MGKQLDAPRVRNGYGSAIGAVPVPLAVRDTDDSRGKLGVTNASHALEAMDVRDSTANNAIARKPAGAQIKALDNILGTTAANLPSDGALEKISRATKLTNIRSARPVLVPNALENGVGSIPTKSPKPNSYGNRNSNGAPETTHDSTAMKSNSDSAGELVFFDADLNSTRVPRRKEVVPATQEGSAKPLDAPVVKSNGGAPGDLFADADWGSARIPRRKKVTESAPQEGGISSRKRTSSEAINDWSAMRIPGPREKQQKVARRKCKRCPLDQVVLCPVHQYVGRCKLCTFLVSYYRNPNTYHHLRSVYALQKPLCVVKNLDAKSAGIILIAAGNLNLKLRSQVQVVLSDTVSGTCPLDELTAQLEGDSTFSVVKIEGIKTRNTYEYSLKVAIVPVNPKVSIALKGITCDLPQNESHINLGSIQGDSLAYCVGALERALIGKEFKLDTAAELKEASANADITNDDGAIMSNTIKRD